VTDAQCTVKEPVEISGVGLFSGEDVMLRCLPAEADRGIVFVRTDLAGRPEIPASLEYVADSAGGAARATSVQNGDAAVMMVEHLMATLYGLGIDNLIIEIGGVEMPIGDGSAKTLAEPLAEAGLRELDAPRRPLRLTRPVTVVDDDVLLVATPCEEPLTVTYVLDYGERFLGCQTCTITVSRETFLTEVAPARTYCLWPEIEFFLKLGLGRGADRSNTLVIEEDGSIKQKLRFPDECARHKILDLVGDIFLAGRLSAGRVLGYKSGHVTNARLARALYENSRR